VASVTAVAGAIGARVNGWVARASVPVLLLAAVVIGLAGLPLRRAESRAVAAAAADGQPVVYLGFVERSVVSDLRDEVLRQ
jgi:hypothetical protein